MYAKFHESILIRHDNLFECRSLTHSSYTVIWYSMFVRDVSATIDVTRFGTCMILEVWVSWGYPMRGLVLTVLLARFFTLQFRYAVFPRRAVTFFEAVWSKCGPLVVSSEIVLLEVPLPDFTALRTEKRKVNQSEIFSLYYVSHTEILTLIEAVGIQEFFVNNSSWYSSTCTYT